MPSNYIGYSISNLDVQFILKGVKTSHAFKSKISVDRAQKDGRFYVKEALIWKAGVGIVYRADETPVIVPDNCEQERISEICPAGFMPKWARRFDMVIDSIESLETNGPPVWLAQVHFEKVNAQGATDEICRTNNRSA